MRLTEAKLQEALSVPAVDWYGVASSTRSSKMEHEAPRADREVGGGARLILENSTVCQKSTN